MGGREYIEGGNIKMAVPRTIVPSHLLDSCLVETNASCTCLFISNVLCVRAKGVY